MKITNIDEAMEEAAKKQPAKEPKKMEKKPAPAKKALPKKKVSAPAKTAKPTAKVEPKEEPKKEEPKATEPEKPVQPWSAKGREANAEKRASMSSDEKQAEKDRSMRRMGFRQQGRGIGDRLKSAWKAFTGPAGGSTQHGQGKYKSVFHEIQRLMEQLRLVESILVHENITAEGLTGGQKNLDVASPFGKLTAADFATLRARRDEIRSVLVGQMIREELHKHNTILAELNPRQRAALSETVKQRSSKMWEQLAEMDIADEAVVMAPDSALRAAIEKYKQSQVRDNPSQHVKIMPAVERPVQKDDDSDVDEGKLSRLAAGLGLAGAAMMGGAQDAEAQSAAQPQKTVQSFTMQRGPDGNQVAVDAQGKPVKMQHTPADSVSTQKSRDMQLAVNKAEFDLRSKGIDPMASRDGKRVFKRDIVQNPDGTFTATISPDRGESPKEEPTTDKVDERIAANKEKKNAAITAIGKDTTEVDPDDGYYEPHDDSDSKGHLSTGRNATNPSRKAFGTKIFMQRGGNVKRPKLTSTDAKKTPEPGSKHAELRDRMRDRRKKNAMNRFFPNVD